jgi:hypothetical protein
MGLVQPVAATVKEPSVHPTLPWAITQLIPSPGVAVGEAGARFGLTWQVTPLLYSFGIDPRLSPWRFFVVEPIVRHGGSIELYASPEYLVLGDSFRDRWGYRVGTRAYFPLVERGDYLSVSLGNSYFRFPEQDGASYEAGAYILFGYLGAVFTYSPGFDTATYMSTLRVRAF